MLTERHEKLIRWLRKRKVATMAQLRHQFQLSHMTVVRALSKHGYYTSYNRNAAYYTLCDVPQFDDWGLWSYRQIGFSRYGTLTQTIVALVEKAPAGLTVRELEERLQTKTANLLCRLVHDGRIGQQALRGRQQVYLARASKQADRQYQQRRHPLPQPAPLGAGLPEGCSAAEVIAVLRQMILSPSDRPDQLARKVQRRGVRVTAGRVRQVIDHYVLEKKRPASP
jgi:hypothetical protein